MTLWITNVVAVQSDNNCSHLLFVSESADGTAWLTMQPRIVQSCVDLVQSAENYSGVPGRAFRTPSDRVPV